MDWRKFIPGQAGAKGKEDGQTAPPEVLDELVYLRNLVAKLQGLTQQQTNQIHFLKEINRQLQERDRVVVNFVEKGGLRRHEERQELALAEISRINQDLEPIFQSMEQGGGLDPELVKKLRQQSRRVEEQLLETREKLQKQRQELLDELSQKDMSLRLQRSDLDSSSVQNQKLKDEIHQLRMQVARYQEEGRENERLRKHISKTENELEILKKKYQVLMSAKERFESMQNLMQENANLKKTVTHLDGELWLAKEQKTKLQIEHEKLMGEYERLFNQL